MENCKIKATIVLATYNCAEHVECALQSIIEQDYELIELIIIDGASTDGTLDILHRYAKHIKILISERDNGIYDAMNKGISLATGDIIGFLGSDDIYLPGAVSAIARGFLDSSADVVYGDVIVHKESEYEHLDYATLDFDKYVYGNILCHQALFVRTSLQKAMMFDLSYRIAADYKFLITLYYSGYKFYHVAADIAVYNSTGYSGTHKYWVRREFRHAVDEMVKKFDSLQQRYEEIEYNRHLADFWRLHEFLLRKIRKFNKKISIQPKKKLVIFGTGKVGHECLSILRNHVDFGNVICFWDNNACKQNMFIEGVPVKKPMGYHKECLIIIATSEYSREISQQLEEAGLRRKSDFWTWDDWVKVLFLVYWHVMLGK